MVKRFLVLFLVFALMPAAVLAVDQPLLKMSDFANGGDMSATKSAFRRIAFTADLISGIRRQDLGDIRVFDGKNRLMPSLVKKKAGTVKSGRQSLAFSVARKAVNSGYIVDRSAEHKRSLQALELQWKHGSEPKILSVRVEHSQDKKNWKTLVNTDVLYNYDFSGHRLTDNTIEINDYTGRYLRLNFLNKNRRPSLASVTAINTDSKLPEKIWVHIGQLVADESAPGTWGLRVNTGLKPDLLKFGFTGVNKILTGSLYNMETVNGASRRKLMSNDFMIYEVSLNKKVVSAQPVDVSLSQTKDWMVIFDNPAGLSADDIPHVRAGYSQHELIFAADGTEPYTVVWGNQAAGAPDSGGLSERIREQQVKWNDIAPVRLQFILDNEHLAELMRSRETSLLLPLSLLAVISVLSFLAYRRLRSAP